MRGRKKTDEFANETSREYYNRVYKAKLNHEDWAKDIRCDPNIALADSDKVLHLVGPKNEKIYQETLKHYPITSAIIEYAEENKIMHWSVEDIIKLMRRDGIDVKKINPMSMVDELSKKMKVNIQV